MRISLRRQTAPSRRKDRTSANVWLVWIGLVGLSAGGNAMAQVADPPRGADAQDLTLATDAVGPVRFVAVHGQRAAVMGYPQQGLEVWSYPVQILTNLQIGIRPRGAATEMRGQMLLRRIEYRPQEVTRVYIGAGAEGGFVVRETLFVPQDRPGAILTYQTEGRQPVDITLHFTPVLDLMWPAAIGGQSVAWHDAVGGYVLEEPLHRFAATIASPETVAHDVPLNSAVPAAALAFTVRPTARAGGLARASVFIGLDTQRGTGSDSDSEVKQLARDEAGLRAQAAAHYAELRGGALEIETPDSGVNQALAWAEVALDQAWVCDAGLGCGLVAGYGPSRSARRPQYDWFFAGDGLIAGDALVAAGEYGRAREELEFILKYQNPQNGMIWHELTQSAAYLDWAGKYPYMYVHVDVTFQFLPVVARYVATSGDAAFLLEHWQQLDAAYRYCASVIDSATRLPRIPADKEGGNEQDRLRDELGLSSAWLEASAAYAAMARETGHAAAAEPAARASDAARRAIGEKYWDSERQFWIGGHADSGKAIVEERSGFSGVIAQHVFSADQNRMLLDRLAGAEFQTDWGTRGFSALAPTFDPDSYARGSSFALETAATAITYWQAHRPATALAIWRTLLPLNWLDAPGHLHEVLAGDVYHQQVESVPEQTWSSAGLLRAAVEGLAGLQVEAAANRVTFSPHLPADWPRLAVRHVHLPHATLELRVARSGEGLELEARNDGEAANLVFAPEIPLGAAVLGADCGGRRIPVLMDREAQDEHARLSLSLPRGEIHCRVRFAGGVMVGALATPPQVGDAGKGLKIVGVELQGNVLTVAADAKAGAEQVFALATPWRVRNAEGGDIAVAGEGRYRITLRGSDTVPPRSSSYSRRTVRVYLEQKAEGREARRAP